MIQPTDYLHIPAWVITELKLKGNERLLYSLIYGFSKDGEHNFHGSLSYLAEWLGTSKQNVIPLLNKLVDKGLINKTDKYQNDVKFCEYSANLDAVMNFIPPFLKNDETHSENQNGGVMKIRTNNINNNIHKDNIITPLPPTEKMYFRDDRDEVLNKWLEYRKQIKKPLKEPSIESLVAKVNKLGLNESEFEDCVNASISNGWQGLFFKETKKPRYDWENL